MRGVDLVKFNPHHRDESLRRSLAPNGEVIVGYVGRLAREKQIERLAPLCSLPGVRVVIVGDGPSRSRLQRKLPSAQFVGFQSGEALSKYFASLDIFVHTGTDETFCQAIQEALASGVPVVAPAAGGPFDLVTHGQNGYLWSPESEVSLLGAVDELVRNRLKRERLASSARPSVEMRTWPSVMDELEGHYRALVHGLSFAYSEMSA
jgi:phosphatidylinositol alpha 1,6-mannosyltransferase